MSLESFARKVVLAGSGWFERIRPVATCSVSMADAFDETLDLRTSTVPKRGPAPSSVRYFHPPFTSLGLGTRTQVVREPTLATYDTGGGGVGNVGHTPPGRHEDSAFRLGVPIVTIKFCEPGSHEIPKILCDRAVVGT